MAIPIVPIYAGVVPNRKTQGALDFTNAAVTWTDYQASQLVPGVNMTLTGINDNVAVINGYSQAAADSAEEANDYAVSAASSANFKGLWSSLSGSINVPATVFHKGAFWQLLYNLSNVAASEPSASSNWAFTSGTRWLKVTASQSAIVNGKMQISATAAPVDIQLVPMLVNDFITVRNNSDSTQQVRLVNSTYTINGSGGSVTSDDNLIILPNTTRTLICRDTNILEIL